MSRARTFPDPTTARPDPPPQPGQRTFGPCPKCGNATDVMVRFHDAAAHCPRCEPESCKWTHGCPETPHLLVHCRRCQFQWFEEPGA